MSIQISRRTLILAPLILSSVVGCTTLPPPKDEEILLERARAYWALVLNNDLAEAWVYEEISRNPRWTLQNYLKRAQLVYDEVQVRSVVVTSVDEARVEVKILYSLPLMRMRKQEATLQDEWKKIDGKWYHGESKSVFFKPAEQKRDQGSAPE